MTAPHKNRWLLAGRELFDILSVRRREVGLLVLLSFFLAITQSLAVGMLSPVLQFIEFGSSHKGGNIFSTLLDKALDRARAAADAAEHPDHRLRAYHLARDRVPRLRVLHVGRPAAGDGTPAHCRVRRRHPRRPRLRRGEGNSNLLSTLTAQVQRGGSAITQFMQQISVGLLIVMYVAVMLALQVKLTLITIVALVLISLLVNNNIKRSRALGCSTAELNNETYSVISERIAALRLIKMLGQEDRETANVTEVATRFGDAQRRISVLGGIVEITIDPLQTLMLFAVIFVGVQWLHASLATIGIFLFILLQLNNNSKAFNNGRQSLVANIDSLHPRARHVLHRANASRRIVGGDAPFAGLHDGIRLERASFAYGDETGELVLRGVDLEIPCRSQTAIVGRSGSASRPWST